MTDVAREPRPLIPALGNFYGKVIPLTWPIVRLAVLMWGAVCFAIALRGGGPYSLDRLLRREL